LIRISNRFDGKTLNCLFIECPSLEDAQALVRCNNGKKLNGRMVSVVLTSQSELLAHVRTSFSFSRDTDRISNRSSLAGTLDSKQLMLHILSAKGCSSPMKTSMD
jgi:RNA recognition motif-containing protein